MAPLIILLIAFSLFVQTYSTEVLYRNSFDNWMIKYNKKYSTQKEYDHRLQIFINNTLLVEHSNQQYGNEMLLELNEFADMSFEEFKSLYLITDPQHCSATIGNYHNSRRNLPNAVDWREKGVVTGVKNQGHCGSCWTFSTTGCLECHHALKTGQLVSLSEQQLVDCAGAFNNHGCNGGLPSQAFEYIHYNGGLESEESYPYTAENGKCHFNSSLVAATVAGVVNITKGAEDDIADAVANVGPVSIAFDVTATFQLYKSGVYKGLLCHKDANHVNHAVLIVGYDQTDSGEQYWIVKNSWGEKWGLKGYFWIERGHNACGLADCASYPVV